MIAVAVIQGVFVTPAHHSQQSPLAVPMGVVVPYDMALDRELRQFSRDTFGFDQLDLLFTRTPFEPLAVTVQQAREISRPELITAAVQAVSATDPSGYVYGCTSGSFVRGLAGERRLLHAIAEAGRVAASDAAYAVESAHVYPQEHPVPVRKRTPSAVTTSGALLEAVHALGITTIAAATPYDEAIGALFGQFFAEAGVKLVHTANLGLTGRIWTVPWQTTYDLVRRADSDDAEAVVVSCTNLPTYEILDQLEQDLGKPVISANQATIWAALRRAQRDYFGPGSALRACANVTPEPVDTADWEGAPPV